jgi:hypothetical protein
VVISQGCIDVGAGDVRVLGDEFLRAHAVRA